MSVSCNTPQQEKEGTIMSGLPPQGPQTQPQQPQQGPQTQPK